MTDREKAIVMAHTGICMLTGDKFRIFHKYVDDIMGRPIMTHEIGLLADTIKEKTKADFMALCADEGSSEDQTEWISVSERMPEYDEDIIITHEGSMGQPITSVSYFDGDFRTEDGDGYFSEVVAWMPLPEPYKAESEG